MTKKAEGKTGKLGFREQVGLFLGNGEVPWGKVRERVLAAGGDIFDVAVPNLEPLSQVEMCFA